MPCLCAVNASGGGGVIAGLAVFAVEAGGVVGVVELGCVLSRDRAFAGDSGSRLLRWHPADREILQCRFTFAYSDT
jgi:hypothetical protein